MLITFSCNKYENITMFGDVAKKLLTLMGHSANVPGAILAEDLPDALARLEKGLKQEKPPKANKNDDDEAEPVISLTHRAIPLVKMLKTAIEQDCNLMWE